MKETPKATNTFDGSLNTDTDKFLIDEKDYLDALNIRNTINDANKFGLASNAKGNTLVPYTQPAGQNTVLGGYENLSTGEHYYFAWNSNGQTQVRKADSTTITQLATGLNWIDRKFINSINLVDNSLLYWTDTEPRQIDLEKSRRDKQHEGNLYLVSANTPNFIPTGTQFDFFVFDADGNTIANESYTFPAGTTQENGAEVLTLFINNNVNLSAIMTAERCFNYVEITFTDLAYRFLFVSVSTPAPFTTVSAVYVPQNYYETIFEGICEAGRRPLNCNPTTTLKFDSTKAVNNLTESAWQFRAQVIYSNNNKSVLSPASDIVYISCETSKNYVEIDFTDEKLVGTATMWLSDIKAVRIVGRPNNDAKYREIAYIEQKDLWQTSGNIGTLTYNFYNDGQYAVIDDITSETQYHNTPIEPLDSNYSICQETFNDRLGYSNFAQDYDLGCIEATLTPEFTVAKTQLYTIRGRIRIFNDTQFGLGNSGIVGAIHYPEEETEEPYPFPVFGGISTSANQLNGGLKFLKDVRTSYQQFLPENGFPVYSAGTPYFTISQQAELTGLPYINNGVINSDGTNNINSIQSWYSDYQAGTQQGDMYSEYELKVPLGKHIVRLGSHWCSFGDKAGKGETYNLNNNGRWQQTSTFTYQYLHTDGTLQEANEVVVEINKDGSVVITGVGVTINTNIGVDNDVYVGEFYVADLCNMVNANYGNVSGYLMDSDTIQSIDAIAAGTFMELQEVTFIGFGGSLANKVFPTAGVQYTDHNGFWYVTNRTFTNSGLRISAITGNGVSIRAAADAFVRQGGVVEPNSILTNVYSKTGEVVSNTNMTFNSSPGVDNMHLQFAPINTSTGVSTNYKTLVEGRVVDADGNGLACTILVERTGRVEFTDGNGDFSILIYPDVAVSPVPIAQRIFDDIIIFSKDSCVIEFDNTQEYYDSYNLSVLFGAGDNNMSNPYAPAFLNDVLAEFLDIQSRKLKAGGVYNFALLFVDTRNRRANIVTNNLALRIPFLTEDVANYFPTLPSQQANGIFTFTLNITTAPEAWFDKVYVLRTKDQLYQDYLQFPVFDAKYVIYYDTASQIPVETTFAASAANEIYLGFLNSTDTYRELNTGSNKSWTYEAGDRVRFISDANGVLYPTGLYDVAIKGVRIDSVTGHQYFVVDNINTLAEVAAGALIEVYRPMPRLDNDQKLYFEIHTCIDIANGQYVDLPVTLHTGDTYNRTRIVPIEGGVNVSSIEDNSISDFWVSRNEDIGRPNFERRDFGRVSQTSVIVYTGKWQQSNQQNNLNEILLTNIVYFPVNYGAINSLKLANDSKDTQVLLVICENKTISVYVGVVQFNDVVGTELVTTSNAVLGSYRTLAGTAGTINPESVHRKNSIVYFYDLKRKKWWKYDNNGMDAISDRKIKTLAESITPVSVISGFEDYYEQYQTTTKQIVAENLTFATALAYVIARQTGLLSFTNNVTGFEIDQPVIVDVYNTNVYGTITSITPLEIQCLEDMSFLPNSSEGVSFDIYAYTTLAYFEPDNKWETRFSYAPEMYGSGGENYYAFHNGNAYLMSSNATRNNWFGIQFKSTITVVSKIAAKAVKIFLAYKQIANTYWKTYFQTPPNASYPFGMFTTAEESETQLLEGVWNSQILRNENDPAFFGNPVSARYNSKDNLRGYFVEATLENESTAQAEVRSIDVFQIPSEQTSD